MREIFERKNCPVGQSYNTNGVRYGVVGAGVPTFFSVTQNGETSYYYENSNSIIHTSDESMSTISDDPISAEDCAELINTVTRIVYADALALGLTPENAANTSDALIDQVRMRLVGTERDANDVLAEIVQEIEDDSSYDSSENEEDASPHQDLMETWLMDQMRNAPTEEYVSSCQHLINTLDENIFGHMRLQNMKTWLMDQIPNVPTKDEFDARAGAILAFGEDRLEFFNLGLTPDHAAAAPLAAITHLTRYRSELVSQETPTQNIGNLLWERIGAIEAMRPNQRRALDLGVSFTRSSALPENVNDAVVQEFGRRLPAGEQPVTLQVRSHEATLIAHLSNLYIFFTNKPIADQQLLADEITLALLPPQPTIAPAAATSRINLKREAEGEGQENQESRKK